MTLPFVDRIEGDVAVLVEGGRERRVPRATLPKGAREGAYLTADLKAVDEKATQEARASVAERRKKLSADDDGGDFSL